MSRQEKKENIQDTDKEAGKTEIITVRIFNLRVLLSCVESE